MLNTKISILIHYILCVLFAVCNADNDDYFEEDFNENKNCKNEEEINKLKKLQDPVRCVSVSYGNDKSVQYEECKKLLTKRLVESCLGVDVAKVFPPRI